jgi:hypothetical protein
VVRTKVITVTGATKITLAFSLHNKDKTLPTPTSKPENNSFRWCGEQNLSKMNYLFWSLNFEDESKPTSIEWTSSKNIFHFKFKFYVIDIL